MSSDALRDQVLQIEKVPARKIGVPFEYLLSPPTTLAASNLAVK